jgi:hypothetical protein
MKLTYSLPVIAALAFLPVAALAQSDATAAPVLVAAADTSAAFSSSSSLDDQALSSSRRRASASAASAVARPMEGGGLPFSGLAVGVKFGMAGVGFDVATPLIPGWLNLRSGASFFSYSPNLTVDNININGAIKFQNAATTVDVFPFHGRLRVSGGMTVYNNTSLAATLNVPAGQSFTVGNDTYYSSPSNPVTGSGLFTFGGRTAPRVSIGTGNMLSKRGRWTFESELGVQFFSQPTVAYSFTGTACQSYVGGVYANCGPISQSDVSQEQANLQSDLKELQYFPVLSVGLSYRIH